MTRDDRMVVVLDGKDTRLQLALQGDDAMRMVKDRFNGSLEEFAAAIRVRDGVCELAMGVRARKYV